jgi:hypothetical protein
VCPLCKRVGNALMPPPIDTCRVAAAPNERSVDDWLDGVKTLLEPQPPAASAPARLSTMASSFLTRLRAIDQGTLVSSNETRAPLNLARSIVDTVRQAELRFRSVALARDSHAALGVDSLLECAAQQRRWLASVQRLAGVLFMTMARDFARSSFVLLWRELHPGDGANRRRIDAFGALGALVLLSTCASAADGEVVRGVSRATFLACLDYVRRALLDARPDDEQLQTVFLRQTTLLLWALGGELRAPSVSAPSAALPSLLHYLSLPATAADDVAVHKRRRPRGAPPLRLHDDELELERRAFRFNVSFPRIYQTPAFFLRLTQQVPCAHCALPLPLVQPLLCLLCGATFCAANDFAHLREHAKAHAGIFLCLALRDSRVYLSRPPLWHSMGTFYFDDHSEVDGGLRRGRPLFLNTDHLAAMLDLWLAHDAHSFATGQL